KTVAEIAMTADNLAELVNIVDEGLISAKIANDIFAELCESGASPKDYVTEHKLAQISDTGAIDSAVDKVIAANPAEVEAYKGGKKKLISFFMGQVMRETKGKANPAVVSKLLQEKLG
ncbi:MAG: Asp-tRNA(Asn)/Glu-tRNA(Gln) amidotransferase GatCAB subunit B, partial [Desulfovibrionaceae bacterium]|nr:Asp-tRNA(Asn)/Glu-tRNA(Gln) amidotransferase GatCAB subunit B [Desulfovibrionaceae bacterium]